MQIHGYRQINLTQDNTRVKAVEIFSKEIVEEAEPWFGLEQEFFIRETELMDYLLE